MENISLQKFGGRIIFGKYVLKENSFVLCCWEQKYIHT